jgi:arabinogalactan endo-1,4-beta-galactosidase
MQCRVLHAAFLSLALSFLAVAAPAPDSGGYAGGSFYVGHDLSSLKMLEDGGAVYHDAQRGNVTRPAEDILRDGGANTIRLRYVRDIPSFLRFFPSGVDFRYV